MKKRILSLLCCAALICCSSVLPAYAGDGEGNIDHGGGNMGGGTSQNIWHTGQEGVRVTVVRTNDNKAVSSPVDLTNKDESDVL